MSTRSRMLFARTAKAAALVVTGGLLFAAPATAIPLDLGSLNTGSLVDLRLARSCARADTELGLRGQLSRRRRQ